MRTDFRDLAGSGRDARGDNPSRGGNTIRRRIRVASMLMLGLILLAAGYGWWSTRQLTQTIGTTLAGFREQTELTSRFSSNIAQELHAAASYLLRADSLALEEFYRLRSATRSTYLKLDRKVERSPEEARLIAEIEAQLALIEIRYATAHRLADLGRSEEAADEARLTLPLVRAMLTNVRTFEAQQERRVAALSKALQEQSQAQAGLLVALLTAGVIAAAWIAREAERTVSRPLERLAEHARRLSAGDLAAHTDESAALPEEVRVLASAMNDAADSLTRLATAESALRQSEKMAALGRMTAGIAHEINSPLAGILNSIQLAREYADEYRHPPGGTMTPEAQRELAEELSETLQTAESATRKVGRFVRTMKEETRIEEGTGEWMTFDASFHSSAAVLSLREEMERRHVAVQLAIVPEVYVRGEPGKFASVVQTLVRNAADAYHGQPGTVWVRLSSDGARARLEVEDRGAGIPEEIRSRIFDHMFTTKDIGQGTGLGLSIAHALVTAHFGGEIGFQPAMGGGTTFFITIPHPAISDEAATFRA